MSDIFGNRTNYSAIKRAGNAGIAHFEDLERGDILGFLCGQFEPHGHFFTRNHEYVVIDNECMFAGMPCLNQCSWLKDEPARPRIVEVCRGIVGVRDEELRAMTSLPEGYTVTRDRDLYDDLRAAKAAAVEYLDLFDDEIR